MRQRICVSSIFQILVYHMGINHGGIQILVTQNFFQCAYIYAVLIHQRGGCMAEFMGGELGRIQSCLQKGFLYKPMNRICADPIAVSGTKQCLIIC